MWQLKYMYVMYQISFLFEFKKKLMLEKSKVFRYFLLYDYECDWENILMENRLNKIKLGLLILSDSYCIQGN